MATPSTANSLPNIPSRLGESMGRPTGGQPARSDTSLNIGMGVPHAQRGGQFFVSVGEGLPVSVSGNGLDDQTICASFSRLRWPHFGEITTGLCKVIAAVAGIANQRVVATESELIRGGQLQPGFVITLTETSVDPLMAERIRVEASHYLGSLKGLAATASSRQSSLFHPTAAGVETDACMHDSCQDSLDSSSPPARLDLARQIEVIADDTRALIGGKTLPDSCTISYAGWPEDLYIAGKIAPLPEPEANHPEIETRLCRIDGFLWTKHTLYVQLPKGAKRKSFRRVAVAYDEQAWQDRVGAAAAACKKGVFKLSYSKVSAGRKVRLTLLDLQPVSVDDIFSATPGKANSH